ncbi:MAG: hypothetical protein RIA09_10410 [Hoeflea sp.]|uniref:hypothetical protein n=1 Tax=Hoeflea sp. TaxID=1940281 RepID=UPI0032EB7C10
MGDLQVRQSLIGKTVGLGLLSLTILTCFSPRNAAALSELKPVDPPAGEAAGSDPAPESQLPPLEGPLDGPDGGLPSADPIIRAPLPAPDTPAANTPMPGTDGEGVGEDAGEVVSVELVRDISELPEPVGRMRELIIEAASTGDPENLRALLGRGPSATRLAFGEIENDPIDYLRSISGDGEGLEILAILIDLLNAGFVRIDAGGAEESYIWPYFAAVPLDDLTAPQRVELLRIVTAGDLEDMKTFGAYNFFRIGIAADGSWRFFLAGD